MLASRQTLIRYGYLVDISYNFFERNSDIIDNIFVHLDNYLISSYDISILPYLNQIELNSCLGPIVRFI